MALRSSSTPAATIPTARQRRSLTHCAMATSSSKEPADNSTSPAGTCASTSPARPGRKVTDRRKRPETSRAATAAPSADLAAEPRVDVHDYHFRPLTKTGGGKGFEHRGQIAVRRDSTLTTRGYAGRASRAVAPPWFPDHPFAGGRGRQRRPRTVGPEHAALEPLTLHSPSRAGSGGVSVDDLQSYCGTLGPDSEGVRPCFPESGQRPQHRGNQDGASCHAHNLSVSNNRPLPRGGAGAARAEQRRTDNGADAGDHDGRDAVRAGPLARLSEQDPRSRPRKERFDRLEESLAVISGEESAERGPARQGRPRGRHRPNGRRRADGGSRAAEHPGRRRPRLQHRHRTRSGGRRTSRSASHDPSVPVDRGPRPRLARPPPRCWPSGE